ncbi:MAG: glycosyltransferase, partial [Bacteroidales bacterium]
LSWKSFRYGMKVCHQSAIVKSSVAGLFSLNHRFSSDFEWLIEVLIKSKSNYNSGIILSKFMEGGKTTKNLIPGLKERFKIMAKYYGFFPTVLRHFWLAAKLAYYYIINRRL